MVESKELKQAREDVALVRAETSQLCVLAEEIAQKAEEAQKILIEFHENAIQFQRDMTFMGRAMQANGAFRDDSETQGRVIHHVFC